MRNLQESQSKIAKFLNSSKNLGRISESSSIFRRNNNIHSRSMVDLDSVEAAKSSSLTKLLSLIQASNKENLSEAKSVNRCTNIISQPVKAHNNIYSNEKKEHRKHAFSKAETKFNQENAYNESIKANKQQFQTKNSDQTNKLQNAALKSINQLVGKENKESKINRMKSFKGSKEAASIKNYHAWANREAWGSNSLLNLTNFHPPISAENNLSSDISEGKNDLETSVHDFINKAQQKSLQKQNELYIKNNLVDNNSELKNQLNMLKKHNDDNLIELEALKLENCRLLKENSELKDELEAHNFSSERWQQEHRCCELKKIQLEGENNSMKTEIIKLKNELSRIKSHRSSYNQIKSSEIQIDKSPDLTARSEAESIRKSKCTNHELIITSLRKVIEEQMTKIIELESIKLIKEELEKKLESINIPNETQEYNFRIITDSNKNDSIENSSFDESRIGDSILDEVADYLHDNHH